MPNPVIARRRFAPWRYLLLARFGGGDRAAPLPSPLPVDVGSLTLTDASNVISQAGGSLLMSGTPAANSGVNSAATVVRMAGRALLLVLRSASGLSGNSFRAGFDPNAASNNATEHGVQWPNGTGGLAIKGPAGATIDTLSGLGNPPHALAFVLRGTGCFLLFRATSSGPYTLLWVWNASTSTEFAKALLTTGGGSATLDDFRVVDLPAPWNSDYGIATTRAINPVAGVLPNYPMSPDSILEFSFTYTSGQTYGLDFRRTSSSNTWRAFATTGGALILADITAGVTTNHLNVASVFTNAVAYRVVVVAEGNVYTLYVNDVLKGTYTDAGSFQTTVAAWVVAFNTDSGMSSAVAWPRTISLPSGA